MSLFSWFFPKPKATSPKARQRQNAPLGTAQAAPAAPAQEGTGGRRNERMVRRELLYTVVRDSMVRSGILSSGYKFKVLSLDQRGAQFLVMVDLAAEYSGSTERLCEIETLITETAKSRFDIFVTSVYWRMIATPRKKHTAAPVGPPAATPKAAAAPTAPAPAGTPAPAPASATAPSPRFEPIAPDEVAAFREALQRAGEKRGASGEIARRRQPISPATQQLPPLGFEDTVIPDQGSGPPMMGVTQYGQMR